MLFDNGCDPDTSANMKEVKALVSSGQPFWIHSQERRFTFATGEIRHLDYLAHINRDAKARNGCGRTVASISLIPFAQLKEREFEVVDGGEKIISMTPTVVFELSDAEFCDGFDSQAALRMNGELTYNLSDAEFAEIVERVIKDEIRQGAGSNFLISRKVLGEIAGFRVLDAIAILLRLHKREFGSYLSFCFFDGAQYFIGASPERHLTISDGIARMNPVCGTLPKSGETTKSQLLQFVQDEKEINELFMVVDETLKMMMPLCPGGGEIKGPFLREMGSVIHTENELQGVTDWDVIDAFRATMFAPTMVGSPIESACRVIYKYENLESRRYYSGAVMIVGADDKGTPYLDSAITIRTIELKRDGAFTIQAGASVVRDSIPAKEAIEVKAKCHGLLRAISGESVERPVLGDIFDASVEKTMLARNNRLSTFWMKRQEIGERPKDLKGKSILVINNEDEFVFMTAHLLEHMGASVQVKNIREIGGVLGIRNMDLIILGPGPGDPTNTDDPKIVKLRRLTSLLLNNPTVKLFGICLGHQLISHQLGFPVVKLPVPRQGVQAEVNLFGRQRHLGFYNTFSARLPDRNLPDIQTSTDELGYVHALRGARFGSIQAHPESVLSKDGYEVLGEEIRRLFPAP